MEPDSTSAPRPERLKTPLESDANIVFFCGTDEDYEIRDKLDMEWANAPLINSRLEETRSYDAELTPRILMIHISSFFTDGSDFVYYIQGYSSIATFLAGTYSGRPYDAPCFATPFLMFKFRDLYMATSFKAVQYEVVSKTETKGLRWKYLYESAIKAWEKLRFDTERQKEMTHGEKWLRQEIEDENQREPEDGDGEPMEITEDDEVRTTKQDEDMLDSPASPLEETASTGEGHDSRSQEDARGVEDAAGLNKSRKDSKLPIDDSEEEDELSP